MHRQHLDEMKQTIARAEAIDLALGCIAADLATLTDTTRPATIQLTAVTPLTLGHGHATLKTYIESRASADLAPLHADIAAAVVRILKDHDIRLRKEFRDL